MDGEEGLLEKLDDEYRERNQRHCPGSDDPVIFTYRLRGRFVWNGVPLGYVNNREKLNQLEDFQFGEEDVLLTTFPKCGTHFGQDVITDIMVAAGKMSDFIYYTLDIGELDITKRDATPKVYTHLPWRLLPRQAREGKVKIVRMTRNPKDIVCSWYPFLLHKVGSLEPGTTMDQFVDLVVNGRVSYGDYFDWLKGWYPHLKDRHVLSLKFEDMKYDLRSNVLKLSAYLSVTLTEDQIDSIVEKNTFANRAKVDKTGMDKFFMRKGEAGGWKKELTEEQINKLDEWISKSREGYEDVDFDCQF